MIPLAATPVLCNQISSCNGTSLPVKRNVAVMGSSYNGLRSSKLKKWTCEILKCIIFVLDSENVNYQSNKSLR